MSQQQASPFGKTEPTLPWVGRVLSWSAALRDKPARKTRGSYEGIRADIPRGTSVTVVGKEGGWLHVEVTLDGKLSTGYVSRELIEYVSPKLSVSSDKLARYRAAVKALDWFEAARLLDGFKDGDIATLLAELSAPQLARLMQGALRALLISLRVTGPIERLNPRAGVVGTRLAQAHRELDTLREKFQVTVVSRKQWGARAPDKSKGWDEYPKSAPLPLYRVVVHHTAEPRAQTARALQDKEMDTAGYADMPYHFVITEDGKVHEGRELDVVGAHAGAIAGNKDIQKDPDYGSIGIVVTGDFESRMANGWSPDTPSSAQLASLQRLINHLVQEYQIDPEQLLKHRDVKRGGKETVCPGGKLVPHVDSIRVQTERTLHALTKAEAKLAAAEQEAAALQ